MTGARPAGIGWRVGARLLDVLVVGWLFAVLLVDVLPGERDGAGQAVLAGGLVIAAEVVPMAAAGLTFGKFAFGLRVVSRRTGRQPGVLAAVVRTVLVWGTAVVTPFPAVVALGVAIIVFGPALLGAQHRGLHDRVAGTVVVLDPERHSGGESA